MSGGAGLPGGAFLFLISALTAAVVGFYAFAFPVEPDELGVVMFFGKPVRMEPPGLPFRQPYSIDEVRLPKVTRQNVIEIGMRSSEVTGAFAQYQRKSLMLTGDRNIVDINFVDEIGDVGRLLNATTPLSIERALQRRLLPPHTRRNVQYPMRYSNHSSRRRASLYLFRCSPARTG